MKNVVCFPFMWHENCDGNGNEGGNKGVRMPFLFLRVLMEELKEFFPMVRLDGGYIDSLR